MDRASYWERMYTVREPDDVGWYEDVPRVSLRRVGEAIAAGAESVIDIGGGASKLVDHLLDTGVPGVAVLDISSAGLDVAKRRLGPRAPDVEWIVADVTRAEDVGTFDVWHDRAVFHFLTDPADRERYVRLAERTLSPGGTAVMATFAPDGPERCSGLPVCRYAPEDLADQCGPGFLLLDSERYTHTTPRGVEQAFAYSTFRRLSPDRQLDAASR